MALILLLASLFTLRAQPVEIPVGSFSGLDDTNAPATLVESDAQDALNVETSVSGTSLLKRRGFAREASLTIATAPANGAAAFTCRNGDKIKVACHDVYCAKSVNDGAFSNFVSTGGGGTRVPKRWSMVAVDGDLYMANDVGDLIRKYDCTNLTYPAGMPRGSMLALSEARLVVGSSQPASVAYSKQGFYSTFTAGVNPEDSWDDPVGAPGDSLTGVLCDRGRCHLFKKTSLTTCIIGDQYTTECVVTSPEVGTAEPNGIVSAPDGVYFTSADGAYWKVNEIGLTLLSRKISNFVKNKAIGSSQDETITNQEQWNNGTQSPPDSWNSTTTAGSIFPSSVTFVDTSSTNFAAGTLTRVSTAVTGSVAIVQFASQTFTNSGGESNDTALNWQENDSYALTATNPLWGTYSWDKAIPGNSCNYETNVRLEDSSGNTVYQLMGGGGGALKNGQDSTFTVSLATVAVAMVRLKVNIGGTFGDNLISVPFIKPSSFTMRVMDSDTGASCRLKFDIDESLGFTTSGDFVSRSFDTVFTTPTYGPFIVNFSSSTQGPITFETQVSADGNSWDSLVAASSGTRIVAQKRYIRYKASFSVHSTTNTTAVLSDVTMSAASTGSYRSMCIEPGAGITFGVISFDETKSGAGSLVYYSSSAATCAAMPVTYPLDDPAGWTAQTNNAAVSVSANAAYRFAFRSILGSTTDQAQVNGATLFWTEGTPAQPVWGAYDSINNAIYWTATTSASATSDRLIKYDLNIGETGPSPWFPHSISATALLFTSNSLYFGSSDGGFWNKYGFSNADNGSNINAYWKSKDFSGNAPFHEKKWQTLSLVARNQVTGNMNATVGFSNGISDAYTVSLATTSTRPYVRANYNLLLRSGDPFINVKISNNSQTPFEVLGIRITGAVDPWQPRNP